MNVKKNELYDAIYGAGQMSDEELASLVASADEQDRLADERAESADVPPSVVDLGLELEALDEQIASLESQVKDHKARRDAIKKHELPDAMQRMGVVKPDGRGNVTLSSGARVSLVTKTYANVKAADKPRLKEWLRTNGAASLIKEDVSGSALSAHVTELQENGHPVPEFISVYRETTAQLTRPRGSKN